MDWVQATCLQDWCPSIPHRHSTWGITCAHFYFLFSSFWPHHTPCGILVPWPGIEPVPPAVEVQSLSHWTAREVPHLCTFLTLLSMFLHLVSSGCREQEYSCHMFFKTLPFLRSGMSQALHSGTYLQCFSPLCCAVFLLGTLGWASDRLTCFLCWSLSFSATCSVPSWVPSLLPFTFSCFLA